MRLGPIEQLHDDKAIYFGKSSDGQMDCLLLVSWHSVPSGPVLVWDSNFCLNPNPSPGRLRMTQVGGAAEGEGVGALAPSLQNARVLLTHTV